MLLQAVVSYKSHSAFQTFLILMPVSLSDMRRQIVLYIVLSAANRTFELMRYIMDLRHVLYAVVVMLHRFKTDLTFHLTFRMSALHVIGFRSLRLQHLTALGTRKVARFVCAFVDLQPFGIKKGFPANVAYAIRIMLVQVSRQCSEDVELLLANMARVRTRIDFVVCNAFCVNDFLVDLAKMAAHLADVCQR